MVDLPPLTGPFRVVRHLDPIQVRYRAALRPVRSVQPAGRSEVYPDDEVETSSRATIQLILSARANAIVGHVEKIMGAL